MRMFRPRLTRSSLAVPLLAALSLLAACGERPPGEKLPTGVDPRLSTVTATGSISVTVEKADGSPASDFLFVPFQRQLGPLRLDGSFAGVEVDDHGKATVTGLALGRYCGTVRGLPGSAYDDGFFVPPANAPNLTLDPTLPAVGAITSSATSSVPFNATNFATYCTSHSPPLFLRGHLDVTIRLPSPTSPAGDPGTLRYQVRDLSGNVVTPPAWAVLPTSLPWQPLDLPAGVQTGLLLSTVPGTPNPSGFQSAVGLPPGDVVLQTAFFQGPSGNPLTATIHAESLSGTTTTTTVSAEPNVCLVDKSAGTEEPLGDAQAGTSPDFVGFGDLDKIRLGWGADADLKLNPDVIAVWYRQRGTGSAKLRLLLDGKTSDLVAATYTCPASGACTVSTRRTGRASNLVMKAFAEPDSNHTTRVSWVISGIPAIVGSVDLQLIASGDVWPNFAGASGGYGYFHLAKPTGACDPDQGSDDKFWLN